MSSYSTPSQKWRLKLLFQKFPRISETICSLGDKSFAVIIDEVHSSQSGQLSKELKKSLSKTDDEDEFDFSSDDFGEFPYFLLGWSKDTDTGFVSKAKLYPFSE